MYTKKDAIFLALSMLGFVLFVVGLIVMQAGMNDTDEIETNIDGYECITRIHYDNRIFEKDRQDFKTYCEKAEHHYIVGGE